MAFVDLYSELTGCIPKLDQDFAKKLVNRAYADIRRSNLWSFQLFEANWISPAIENSGTVTVVQGSSTVTFDATASTAVAALAALTGPFPTPLLQRQFRQGSATTIYNIWAYDGTTPSAVELTLDRPYVEESGSDLTYSIYQCYYPAPMEDWLSWINVRDMTNFNDLRTLTTRAQINAWDPQRSIYYLPTDVVPYQNDQNPDSDTYGWQLFELWGQPSYVLPYQLYGIRRGTPLVADTDALPFAIGEDVVIEGAKIKAYEWAEANKGDLPRNQGADYRFLIGECKKEFARLIRSYRKDDRERVDNWFTVRRRTAWLPNIYGFYNSLANTASPGAPW